MIIPGLYIDNSEGKGRGVFASVHIPKDTIIEISPVIEMSAEERKLLDQTLLHDYIFEWGESRDKCCMALGYIAVYNHSSPSNCEYFMDFAAGEIMVKSVRNIESGEEITINYNGDWDNDTEVWFKMV